MKQNKSFKFLKNFFKRKETKRKTLAESFRNKILAWVEIDTNDTSSNMSHKMNVLFINVVMTQNK